MKKNTLIFDGSNYNFNHIDNERFLEFKEKIGGN